MGAGTGGGGCKLERQGQHKFQDREAETMEGKTVQEQKCIEKAAKTGQECVEVAMVRDTEER